MRSISLGVGLAVLGCVAAAGAQGYSVKDHWRVGGAGGWDYLLSDDAAHRLYITHNARVEVVDTTTGKPVGAVTGFKSTHGVALNPDGKTGYASDGAGNAIVVFDRTTLAVKETIAASTNPDGIAYDTATKTVWAFNGRSNDATVMDATTNKVVATIKLPGKPEFPQTDGKGFLYVNIEDKNSIVKLDTVKKVVVDTWVLKGCESPSGMSIDRAKHRLFSVCDGNKMAVTSYDTGKVLALATIGEGPDATNYDSAKDIVFSSNGDGTLTIIDASKPTYPVLQTIKTAKGARTMAYNQSTGQAYLSAAQYGPAPAPTAAQPKPRPVAIPDSFEIIVVGK
jgi:YVTN family beta-propeller protein